MKLTKGKISKLYGKIKQTLKNYNKTKVPNNKSFRKNIHVDLKNKTLKNFKGGDDNKTNTSATSSSYLANVEDTEKGSSKVIKEPVIPKQEQDSVSNKSSKTEPEPEHKTQQEKDAASESLLQGTEPEQEPEKANVSEQITAKETEPEKDAVSEQVNATETETEPEKDAVSENVTTTEQEPIIEPQPVISSTIDDSFQESKPEIVSEQVTSTTEVIPAQENVSQELPPVETKNENLHTNFYSGSLPENVSNAAKTIIDYAVDSIADKLNNSNKLNNEYQNPENAFTDMANLFNNRKGGKSRRAKNEKNKKTKKNLVKV
jgi:hypothetical protein